MDLHGVHDGAIGVKVDNFSARKLRALDRRNQSEGNQARPMSEVGAAICGSGYGGGASQAEQRVEALRNGRRPGPDYAPTQQAYAAMLQQQVEEKRALQALDAPDRGKFQRPQRPREDSLDRLMSDGMNFPSENVRSRPAGRAHSQPALAAAPFARQDDHLQVQESPARKGSSAPWAQHDEQYQALPMQRGRGGGAAAARAKGLGGAAPFAIDADKPDSMLPNRGRVDAPFPTSNEQMPVPVPGLPGRHAMPPRLPGDKPAQRVLPQNLYASGAKQNCGISSNMYACGANQNCGNVITDKPTSRVLRPPGGGGSLQIGSW